MQNGNETQIGHGIDGIISSAEIKDSIGSQFGMSLTNGKWRVDSDHPSATKNTIAASDIVIDLEHDIDFESDQFSEDFTVTDMILSNMADYEDGLDDSAYTGEVDN